MMGWEGVRAKYEGPESERWLWVGRGKEKALSHHLALA